MMQQDPIFGPLSRDTLFALAAAPAGEALKAIRKFDPLWGRQEGEGIEWKVMASRTTREVGYTFVTAPTQKDAEKIADAMSVDRFHWDGDDTDEFEILSVEAKR